MSVLVKPYEISVWEDVWDNSSKKFVEKKLLTIGSHLMKSQNRVLNPDFVTNVNGTKKLSFQMYKQYRDSVTGEKVSNPFYAYLANERKVKLKYKDEWHDFIIKNINETSTNYLYSYQLEDAFVNELSKNGFNVELSAEDHSNLGTANELANRVLEGTDWNVSDDSEVFVQKNEEALVYLTTTTAISCQKILDNGSNYLTQGVTNTNATIASGVTVLAFYSCCKDKPHRFQFIYPVTGLAVNDRRLITNKNYQYFIEYDDINSAYQRTNNGYQFVIPSSFNFIVKPTGDTFVSSKYRAERYVYTPKTKYFSLLDKYMQAYTKNGETYYGYEQTDYIAPTLITNLIDNTEFTSTSGWVAGITADSEIKPVIENKYGRWDTTNKSFVTIQDDWKAQNFSETVENQRKAYLHVTAGSKKDEETITYAAGHVINSGFYSNRVSLGKITEGEKFILRLKMRNSAGDYITDPTNYLTPYLRNINYNTANGYQILGTTYATFTKLDDNNKDNYCSWWLTVREAAKNLTDKQFRNLKVKLGFSIPASIPTDTSKANEFYIEDAQLFKYIPKGTSYLTPDDQSTEAVVNKTYNFYKENDLNTITSLDELPVENCTSLDYNTYKPVYSPGAQKVRTLDAKESNYFNILQSIAEKFEAWLRIKVGHDSVGRPTTKEILFKNYVGKDNYAGFRYGVNLKGIERQNNAQQLATKLIVKNNQNEHAENKTCSISYAPSNESGENYLYNFDYYVTQGLLNAEELDAYLYDNGAYINSYWAGKFGDDVIPGNVGYYTYLKFLNNFIQEKNKQLIPLQVSQNSLIASKTLAEEGKSATIDELEAAYSNFEDIAQVSYPIFTGAVQEAAPPSAEVECEIVASYSSEVKTVGLNEFIYPNGADKTLENLQNLSFNTEDTVHMMIWENDNFVPPPQNPNLTLPLFVDNQVTTTFTYQSPAAVNADYVAIVPSVTANIGGSLYNTSMAYGFAGGKLSMMSTAVIKTRAFAKTATTENVSSTTDIWLGAKGNVSYEVPVGTSITGISIDGISLDTSEFTYDNGLLSIDLTTKARWEALGMGKGVVGDRKTFTLTISLEKTVQYTEGSPAYEELVKREDIQEILQEITELLSAKRTHNKNFIEYEAKLNSLQLQINNLNAEINSAINEKKIINQQFYAKYHRFIQEGTWIDEQYIDPELYYVDAQSVLYESCYPAITYTINLLELSQLEGYELYSYELGDKTFAEDEEFFGEEKRVEVIVTEISNKLDSPEHNAIKTQTYKNQFQDLFQKITATVQQAQYNTGAYEKAAGMVEASETRKQEYLEGAISDLATLLTDAGEATVEQTNTGIIIKEKGNSGNQLKLTGGALMFGQFDDETGEMTWKSGLSTKGMAAEMITSGKLNTGALQIMNGNEAVFRWDALGISAFDYQTDANDNYTSRPNVNKFVRFDKHGLYGVNNPNISGVTWKPGSGAVSAEEDIAANAAFKLTWDGLSLTPQNTTYTYKDKDGKDATVDTAELKVNAKLGKVDNYIYNDWDANGFPIYTDDDAHKNAPKFVKVFAVGDKVGGHTSEQFVLYSDGTIGLNNIKLTGDIQWTAASSPSKNIYGKTNASKPVDNTLYNKFPENASTETTDDPNTVIIENSPWHKNYDQDEDIYYCHTDDGGATWQGPFLITGQSIIDTETEYIIADTGLSATALNGLTDWSETYPTEKPDSSQCVYIRIRDKYNSGEFSAWRYMSGVSPIGDFELTASELVIKEDQNVKLTPETITLTANCINLPSGGYYKFTLLTEESEKWESIQGSGGPANQRTLEAKRITTSGRIKATYTVGGKELASDEIVINRVKEGSDAISVILTNPSMVFNELDSSATESTKVRVLRGASELALYDSSNPSDWTYQLISSGTKVKVSGEKFIVKNPGKATTFQVQIKIYKTKIDDTDEYDTVTYNANINCNIINNNIQISLSNDVAVVGTKADGTLENTAAWNSALAFATENTVSVFKEGKDVTSDYTFTWSIKNANTKLEIIPKTEDDWKTIYLRIPEDDGEEIDEPFGGDDTIIVQVEVKKGTQTVGTKEFKVSKNYQGESAVSYRLIVTPNSWNISDTASQSLQFSMVKSTGSTPENIPINDNTTGYWIAIKAILDGKQGWMKIASESITETSTFALVEGVDVEEGKFYEASELEILDEETVTAVRNGTNGDPGEAGDTVGAITIYCSTENTTSPNKPNTTNALPSGWSGTEITPSEPKIYVWSSTGSFRTTADGKTTYSNWTSPTLYSAYNDYGIDSKKYAEYLAATNFGNKQTITYGTDGELYINASYINTGALTVKTGGVGSSSTGTEILFAGLNEKNQAAVRLAGWNVNSNSLTKDNVGIYSSDQTKGIMICNTEKTDWRFVAGSKFGVDKEGKLYCTDANISGKVTASSGQIAGFSLAENKLNPTTQLNATYQSSATFGAAPALVAVASGIRTAYGDEYNGDRWAAIQLINQKNVTNYQSAVLDATAFRITQNSQADSNSTNYWQQTEITSDGIRISSDHNINISLSSTGAWGGSSLADSNSIRLEGDTAYITAGRNGGTGDFYIKNLNRTKDIVFIITESHTEYKQVKVSDLVFKGPYNIKHNGNVVGRVCQLGPVVYGKVYKQDSLIDASVKTLSIENGSSPAITGPSSQINLTWLVNQVDSGGYEVAHLACMNRNNLLSLEIGSFTGDAWSGNAAHRFDTYFCYCLNGTHSLE